MKMVKSLLLGTAAGLVAMTGAQAADLPVKAKPVQYVKICSLYGAGFYYIPGTDTCIKVGGYVRMQTQYNVNGNSSNGPFATNVQNRTTTDYTTRNRAYITADARSQTEYGTLRSYFAAGTNGDNVTAAGGAQSTTGNFNRAFVQFAGFTAGRAISAFDFTNTAVLAYMAGGAMNGGGGQTTGDSGWNVLTYTAQLGNGMTANLSVEDARGGNTSRYATAGGTITAAGVGTKMPDFVGNVRIDQSWGSAQVMGAIHDASATYYDAAFAAHPGNKLGYAFGVGAKVNLPMLGKGDYIDVMFAQSKGATRYTSAGVNLLITQGGQSGNGLNQDAIYSATAGSNLELTTQWSVFGGYEHNWNSNWKTSAYGSYVKTQYSDTANAVINSAANVLLGANANSSQWQIGSRTAWAPVNNLEVGVDVMYTKLNAANTGSADTSKDASAWVSQLRVQRNFYP